MRFHALIAAALLTLSACATPFQSKVSRFQQMPAPAGQSFVIQAADTAKAGGLEFSQYAALVRERLMAQGYQPAASPAAATLVVELDYGVNNGREKIESRPGMSGPWGPWGWGGWGPYYGRYGWHGWYDPFWGPWGWDQQEVYSYTVYNSHLAMKITRTGTGDRVFEGRAEAQTRSDDLTTLVPNLVQAMFTNFPGHSGETVRVSIPPPAKSK